MASQELRTQLVFEAANAIKNAEALHGALKKIARVDFSKLAAGFGEISKSLKEMVSDVAVQSEKAAKVAQSAAEKAAAAEEKARVRAAKAEEAALIKAAKVAEDAQKKKLKAVEEEADAKQKMQSLTLKLIEQENKAVERLKKKLLEPSDFVGIQRRLGDVAAQVDKVSAKLKGGLQTSVAVAPFMNYLKRVNDDHVKEAIERTARAQLEADEKVKNLFRQHAAKMWEISDKYTQNPKVNLEQDKRELIELTRDTARLSVELGKVAMAASYFRQAFDLSKGRKEFAGLVEEIQKFRQAQKISKADWDNLSISTYLERYKGLKKALSADEFASPADAAKLQRLRAELAGVSAELSQIYKNAGDAKTALKYIEEALRVARGNPELQKQYAQEYEGLLTVARGNEAVLAGIRRKIEGTKEWREQQRAMMKQMLADAADEERAANIRYRATQKQIALEDRLGRIRINEQTGKFEGGKPFTEKGLEGVIKQFERWSAELKRLEPWNDKAGNFDAFLNKIKATNAALISEQMTARNAVDQQASYQARGAQLIKEHRALMNKIAGDYTVGKLGDIEKDQQRLVELTRTIGGMYSALGKASTAAAYFKQALNLAGERKEFAALVDEIRLFNRGQKANDTNWKMLGLDSYLERYRLLKKEMQSDSFNETVSKTKLDRYQRELAEVNAELARIYRNTGEAAKGVKHLEEAIELMSGHSRIQKKYKDELADLMTLITQQELALKQTREKVWGTPEWKAAQREKERAQEQQRRQAERQAELDRKADEEKAARYERLARLAGRVAEIQAKVNEKFNAGKAFSEAQFVRLRNELHRLGVEMDHLTGKNVSGYVDYIMNSVKVKNTPQMSSTAKSLSDQYNEVRKRAEEAAQQFAKTRSIADGIRFGAAMNDLKAITAQTEQLNRMLGKTNGLFKYLTELVYRRAVWHFGEGAVNWLLSFPSTILQSFRDVEQAMAGVQQVMPFIEGNPDRTFGETTNLIDIATQYARSVQEVTEGAQLWGRGYAKPVNDADVIRQSLEQTNEVLAEQGIAVEQVTEAMVDYTNEAMAVATTNELVRQSAILATVDNFSMIESVKGLEAVLAAYGLRAKTAAEATLYAGRAVDIITKVAHYGQISAQDLVRGIEATGAAAEQTGISLEFLTALIETGVRNTAKGGADIGNAIKALTVGLYSDKGQKQLQKFGIETTFIDDEGVKRARSAQAIILDIARALQEGSVNSQKMLLAISGGRYQYSKIRSILKDEEEILRMWAEAIESSGFADKQLEIQMNTLNAKIKQFQANVQSLYQTVMDGWFGDVLKTGVELLSSGIKLLENNFNALSAGAATFLSIFAASKIWSIGASVLALVRNLATFRKELQAAGYAGGLLGVLKEGLFASPAAFVNRYRQQTIATTQALTQTERMLTAEEQRQITVQAAMIRGVAEVIAIRSRESGATAAAAEATRLKTIADEMETAALAKKTAAAGASAAATSAAAEATLAAGAAARVAAAGASLLWGLIFLGIPILVSLAAESDSAAEKLDKLTDATQRAVSEKEKERSSLLQEITQRKKQIELMDQAIDYYIEARRALESYVEGTEDWNKANKRVKNSEEALLIAFRDSNEEGGKEAAKAALARIKASDDIRAAFEKEKASFINGTKEKEEAIKPLDVKLEEFYDKRIVETENIIKMREADIKSFGRWTDAQLEGLDWFQRGYLKFWEFMYNATDSHFWDREGFVGDTVHNFAKRQAIGKGWFGLGLQSELDDWKKQLEDAKQKKAELVSSEVDNALPFEASGIEGAIPDEDDEGGKSKKKKQVVEQYNTVAMRYLAAISEQDKRLNVSDLVAAAGYVRGGDGQTWEQMPFDAVNPLGVNQATLDKYRPNGSLDNPEDVARAFVERLQDFEGSAEEFFTQWYMEIGLAKDAVEAATLAYQTLNQSEYLTKGDDNFNGIDYKQRIGRVSIREQMTQKTYQKPTMVTAGASETGDLRQWARDIGLASDEVFNVMSNTANMLGLTAEELKLALAVAMQESGGRQDVTSSAEAIGVMQLMPETAAELGVNPYDMQQNVLGGMIYLQQMLDKYKDRRLALVAYNAGEGAVDRYGAAPSAETQNYVAAVEEMLRASVAGTGQQTERYPNIDDYVEYKGNESSEGLTELTKQKIGLLAKEYFETFGEKFFVTAGNDDYHRGTNSWHEYGQAVDIAMDSLYDENRRQWLAERAEYYGLVPLDEYANPSARSTAPHYHFSDHGENLEPEKIQTVRTSMTEAVPYVEAAGKLSEYWKINEQYKAASLKSLEFEQFPQLQREWDKQSKDYEKRMTAIQHMQQLTTTMQSLVPEQGEGRHLLQLESEKRMLQLKDEQLAAEQDYVRELEFNVETLKLLRNANDDLVEELRKKHGSIDSMLEEKGTSWDKLTADQKASIADKLNDKKLSNEIKLGEKMRSEWEKINKLLVEHKNKLVDIRAEMATIGVPKPPKQEYLEEYALKNAGLNYEGSKIGAVYEDQKKRREYLQEQIDIYQARKERLERELAEINEKADRAIAELDARLNKEASVRDSLVERQQGGENVNSELEIQEGLIKRLADAREKLSKNSTQEQLDYRLKIKETDNAIKKLEADMYPLEQLFQNKLKDGIISMFDAILIKGNSFKEAWNNLWQSIASFALQQLLMVSLSKTGWFGGAGGGKIPSKAEGGAIEGFADGGMLFSVPVFSGGSYVGDAKKIDAGQIKGAGTGTSDSILTYLEHRGQFIRTSDGEFIIKKKSVDTLGLSFLNRLNDSPEQFALREKVLNAYDGGGSLGEEVEPVMSDKTVENLQTYSKLQTDKGSQNTRQEKLLENISMQLSAFTRPVNETTNMNINAVDSRSFVQLLEKHSDVIMGLMRKERGRRNVY